MLQQSANGAYASFLICQACSDPFSLTQASFNTQTIKTADLATAILMALSALQLGRPLYTIEWYLYTYGLGAVIATFIPNNPLFDRAQKSSAFVSIMALFIFGKPAHRMGICAIALTVIAHHKNMLPKNMEMFYGKYQKIIIGGIVASTSTNPSMRAFYLINGILQYNQIYIINYLFAKLTQAINTLKYSTRTFFT